MKLSRYIQGLSEEKDAHRLELEAMRDPFLADALDGYDEISGNHKRAIEKLRKRVRAKARNRPNYLKPVGIAASILIIIGVGTYFLMQENHPVENTIVAEQTLQTLQHEELPQASAFALDTVAVEEAQASTLPKPVIGEEAYNKYLRDKLIRPTDDDCKNVSGTVIVAFYVNARGRPHTITTRKRLCPAANKEAIRLVAHGPAWTPGDQEVTVTVTF